MALLFTILVVAAFATRLGAEIFPAASRPFTIAAWSLAFAASLVWAPGRV